MEPGHLQSFYDDLNAARIARVPVELSSHSLLRGVLQPTESELRSFAEHPSASHGSLDDRHQAAIDVYNQVGSMVPVLDGLSARAIAVRELSRVIRRVLWYLALVLLVALIGLLYFRFKIAPAYELLREDMRRFYQITEFSLDAFPYVVPAIIAVAILLAIILGMLFTGRTEFLLSWFGGRKYVRLKVSSAAAKTLALLASQDAPLEEATKTTATLYALDSAGKREFCESIGDAASPDTCRNLSQYWLFRSARALERVRAVAPSVLLVIVGGGVAGGYALVVYGPLMGLIRDLIEAGFQP